MPVYNSYQSVVAAKSPSIWIKSNETAGTPTNSGSLSCSLTAYGVPQLNYDSSVDGRSIYLNGSSGYQLSNFPSFSLLDDRSFTVEIWFKSPTTGYTSDFSGHFFRVDTPNAGVPGGGMGFRIFGTGVGNAAFYGRLELYVDAGASPLYNILSPAGVSYNDNMWHHAVATINTTSIKMYVDGALIASQTIATSAIDWDDLTGTKTIGYSTTTSEFFKGQIDEFAIYDRELSPSDINANYVAGAAVYFNDIPGTASAAMVQPVLTTQTNYLASPMTASSLAGDTRVSNFNTKTTLPGYLSTLSLEQNLTLDGDAIGPGGAYSRKFLASNTTYYQNSNVAPLQDGSWSAGLWVNVGSGMSTDQFRLWYTPAASSGARILIGIQNGNPIFQLWTSQGDNNYAYTSLDMRDNSWHYLAMRVDNKTVRYYVDGTQVFTDTFNGTRTHADVGFSTFGWTPAGLANSTPIYISSFYIAPLNTVGATEISNIWTAGNNNLVQATTGMIMPSLSFNNAYNDYVQARGAEIDLRFNSTGTLVNNGAEGTAATISEFLTAQHSTKGILTKNTKGYQFLDAYDWIDVVPYQFNDWNGSNTHSIYAKFDAPNESVSHNATSAAFISGLNFSTNSFGAIVIGWTASGVFLGKVAGDKYDPSQWSKVTVSDASLLGTYHLYTVVEDGTTLRAYIDGKLVGTLTSQTQFPNYNQLTFNYTGFYGNYQVGPGFTVDELQIYDYPLTTQQVFEMYQSINIDGVTAAQSVLVMPTNAVGTGVSPAISPMIANTGTLPMPARSLGIGILHDHFEAFGAFVLPNYGANVNIDANYGASPLIANALFHMPQANIGDGHTAVPMTASALMGNVTVILPGQVQANPGVANNATLVMPGIVTIKGARIFAEVLTVRAIFPLPPAYVQLTDDPYYVRLYAEHSQKTTEAAQTFAAAGTSTTGFTAVAKSFLKFFNDVTQDITVGSSRFLTNEMPNYVYDAVGTTYTDSNGNTIAPPTTKRSITSAATRGSLTPTPMVSKGYFDAWDRKAVNFTNIEFNFGTDSQNHSQRQYSVEFTVKTTKSNQVMTYGNWASFYNYQSSVGTIGLFNGKLYSMETFQNIGTTNPIPHPANLDALAKAGLNTGYMLGNKRIDDGQWHHIVIQYGWEDGRTQYWIDGELDRQMIGTGSVPGSNGKNGIRPFIIGFNSNDTNLSSDFQTSVWSWTPNKFLLEQDISLNYEAAYKFSPIFAEPMLASMTATPNNKAAGNRGRALMLYFWPTNVAQNLGNTVPKYDFGYAPFDTETFDPALDTVDYVKYPPQEYEGWDVFPVDITGYYVSDLVKVEAYGGAENILFGDGGGAVLTTGDANRAQWKFNSRGTFRDLTTDAARYIDLVKDIDLTQFDAIFFKNFPDQSREIDAFAKDEIVDSYFRIRELKIYEDFIKSVRAAVDTGLSLYVTNTELAFDLGIIDRVEEVSDMDDIVGFESDVYAPTVAPILNRENVINTNGDTIAAWMDTYKNNKFRLVNEVPGMTNFPTVILTERVYWKNDDQIKWGGVDVNAIHLEIKPNGLAVGDEWIESNFRPTAGPRLYQAVPFANIKAGKPVVAFANQVRRDLDLIDNPYKNYATAIVVEPGNPLNGSICGGKIYVNFTERLKDAAEDHGVDLIQDRWINYAESEEIITAEYATQLRAATYNIDRQLAAGTINQTTYNDLAFWSSNSNYILQQNNEIGDDSDTPGRGGIAKPKTQRVRKVNKNGGISFQTVSKGSAWFSVSYSFQYPRVTLDVPSMLTRGFWWISNKEEPEGTVVRVLAMTASATSGQAIAIPDKIISVNAQSMVASANITEGFGYTRNSINNISLPMAATALMNDKVFRVNAEPMRAAAATGQLSRALTSSIDEVIVYIMHEDPILYLREEVIK